MARMNLRRAFLGFAAIVLTAAGTCLPALSQQPLNSHEVHPDGSITFRFKDLGATRVQVQLDGAPAPLAMEKSKDDPSLWVAVTPPLAPAIYGYSFDVDGQTRLDPMNHRLTPNLLFRSNSVKVPGKTPQTWDALDVPHGALHHHFYTTKVVLGLADNQSDYFVYTPPGYDARRAKPYPVLYLLHGWSDLANGWSEVGEANFILDNLIAQGKAEPMVVVMPLGYGDMKFVLGGDHWGDPNAINHNVDLFTQALLAEVMPRVESAYRVATDRDGRAITGLSMGGLESLTVGLTHAGQFAWVGGFSSAAAPVSANPAVAALTAKSVDLRLLWIACGTEDGLTIAPNRELVAKLKAQGLPVTAIETPGMHDWMVWRDNLTNFVPLLFKGKP